MCRWMGSHFHDWIDYNGVAFSLGANRVTRMGSHIFRQVGIWGSGGWTRSAKHDGAIDQFELSCNEPSYCADLEEQIKNQLQELEITKMEVSPILVV